MQKIDRLMAIVLALKKNKKMTAKELSNLFEVDVRTIYRDIQALSEINVPVISHLGNEGGYEIQDSYFIPPIMFNKDEVFALLLAKKIVDIIDVPGFTSYSNSAFLKIENLVSDCFKKEFQEVENRIIFDLKSNDVEIKDSKIFQLTKQSLKNNYKMKVIYNDTDSQIIKQEIINPYGLVFEDGVWYIVAFSELKNSKFNLNIEDINQIDLLEETFDFPKNFTMLDYFSTRCFQNQNKNDNSISIKLKVNKSLYPKIKDYVFFKYGNITEENDNFIITIKTTNIDFYISLGFRFFHGMEIVEPLWVRDKFKKQLLKLNKAYQL